MIEDFEDWRLKCLMLVKHSHHIEPSRISETLLRVPGRTRRQKYTAERVQQPRRPRRLTAW
jgi:hypothetical protein